MSNRDILVAILVALLMGINVLALNVGTEDCPPFVFLALRSFVFWPLLLVVPRPKIPLHYLLSIGIGFGFLSIAPIIYGVKFGISVGMASLLIQTGGFFVILFQSIFLKVDAKPHHFMGMVIGFTGVAYMTSQMGIEATVIGAFFVLCAALCWAMSCVLVVKTGTKEVVKLGVWHCSVPAVPMLLTSLG